LKKRGGGRKSKAPGLLGGVTVEKTEKKVKGKK